METDLGSFPTPGAPPDDDHRVGLNGRHQLLRPAGNGQLPPLLEALGTRETAVQSCVLQSVGGVIQDSTYIDLVTAVWWTSASFCSSNQTR